jgi:hypothetical protein
VGKIAAAGCVVVPSAQASRSHASTLRGKMSKVTQVYTFKNLQRA